MMLLKVLHSICQKIWKTQQWPQDWKRSVFIPIPKKGNAKECSNCCTIVLISHVSKVMLKILQARLQQYMNEELPDVQDEFRKRQRNQRSNCQHLLDHRKKKKENSRKASASLTTQKPLTMCIRTNWKTLKEVEIPDNFICLLRNLYGRQEATVGSNSWTWDNELVQNWERCPSRLYIVTLLI